MNQLNPIRAVIVQPLAATPSRFDRVSIALHWSTVVLIAALFASAWSIGLAKDAADAAMRLTIHRSLGVTLWAVALVRLGWRLGFAVRPPLPNVPGPQRLAATLTEAGLYLILLVQPLSGLAQSLTRGRPFQIFVFQAPTLMARDKALTRLFHELHERTAWVLLGLIALHVFAALFHRLVLKDRVLQSMWPAREG